MPEWWTYGLSDFLMFSPRTYYRQIELYNLAIWPAQLVGAGIGAAILAIPLEWFLVSADTLGPLDAPEVWAVLLAMALVLWVATRKS